MIEVEGSRFGPTYYRCISYFPCVRTILILLLSSEEPSSLCSFRTDPSRLEDHGLFGIFFPFLPIIVPFDHPKERPCLSKDESSFPYPRALRISGFE